MLRYKLKYEKLVYCRYRKRGLTFWAKVREKHGRRRKGLRSKRLIDLTFYIGSTPTVYISTCNTKSGLKKWENLGQNVGVIVLLYFMIYAGHLPIYLHTNGFLCHDDMQLALQMSWHPTNITVMPNSCVDFSIVLFQIQSCNSATLRPYNDAPRHWFSPVSTMFFYVPLYVSWTLPKLRNSLWNQSMKSQRSITWDYRLLDLGPEA